MTENRGNTKVVVVDDEVELTALTELKLKQHGYDVCVVNDSCNAFEIIKSELPRVVILDIMMPGITGYELCRRIRRDPVTYKIPVLILTALGQEPEILHALEQGADDYLVKPFSPDKLIEMVENMVELADSIELINPLTGMPMTEAIKREINYRIAREAMFAACYIDILRFQPYRRAYGDDKANQVIKDLSKLLERGVEELGIYEAFVGHMGAENFIAVLPLDDFERYCNHVLNEFNLEAPKYYSETDRSQGYVHTKGRDGQIRRFPLMCLSIGVVHNRYRKLRNAAKVFEVLAQVKHKTELEGKSEVFIDRRRQDR